MNDINNVISELSSTFLITEPEVISKLADKNGWDSKYREVMLLGKQLPIFDAVLKTDSALVSGCESQVWLHHVWQDERLQLIASSDSKIVRGLLVIVLAKFNGKTAQEIQNTEIENYFSQLGLEQHLSPSRANGLNAIVQRIKEIA